MNRSRGTAAVAGRAAVARMAAIALFASAALVSAALSRPAGATQLFITNHVNSNQIAGLTTWQGKIAAATLGGVVVADPGTGALQKIMSAPGGLPSNEILCVAATGSGSLWAGTAEDGVARLKPDGGFRRTLTTFDGLPSDRVQTLYARSDSIWVGTSGGVALFTENPVSGQIVLRRSDTNGSTAGGLVSNNVLAFQQVGDTLWCGTAGGLSVLVGAVWTSRAATLGVSVRALAHFQDTLWAATAAGPRRYADGSFTIVAAGHGGGSAALESSGTNLHSATAGAGAYRYSGSGWVPLGSSGLASSNLSSLATAPDGRLWVGSDAGLGRHEGGGVWSPFPSAGPGTNGSQRAVTDARGAWFATGNFAIPTVGLGSVLRYDGQNWSAITSISAGSSLQATSVFAILSDRDGKLWFGHCCSGGNPVPRTERYDPATGVWDTLGVTNLYAIEQAQTGLVYGASVEFGSGVYVFDGSTAALLDSLTPLNTQGSASGVGLASNNLRGIAFDTSGRGWFAHATNGLDIWDGKGTIGNHADDDWDRLGTGFPSSSTTAVVTTGATSGWVGTVSGLARIRNDAVDPTVTSNTNASLPSVQVRDLALDSGGNLWVATAAGVARVDVASGAVEHWGAAEGLAGDDVLALAWDASRGALWVGTSDGISEVYPGGGSEAGFSDQSYLYPNPLGGAGDALRLGGITDEVSGEVRDVTGRLVRRFTCNPAQNEIWDLRLANGSPASSGVYIIVLREGDRSRLLRAAVVR